jgi:hypothetical protein
MTHVSAAGTWDEDCCEIGMRQSFGPGMEGVAVVEIELCLGQPTYTHIEAFTFLTDFVPRLKR